MNWSNIGNVKASSLKRGEKQIAFFIRESRTGATWVVFLWRSVATSADRTIPGPSSAMARR